MVRVLLFTPSDGEVDEYARRWRCLGLMMPIDGSVVCWIRPVVAVRVLNTLVESNVVVELRVLMKGIECTDNKRYRERVCKNKYNRTI
jgi:hypothetical protein